MSGLRNLIRRSFINSVNKSECDADLKASLKDKKNLNRYVDHWTTEITKANFSKRFRAGAEYKKETIEDTVRQLTENLIHICQVKAGQRMESYLAQKKREADQQKLKDLESSVDGKLSGDYEAAFREGGVLIGDTEEVTHGQSRDQKKGTSRRNADEVQT